MNWSLTSPESFLIPACPPSLTPNSSFIRWFYLWALLLFFYHPLPAQTIHGYVREAATGEPIAYANIVLKGTDRGTVSNLDGYYVLSAGKPGEYELLVTFMGYAPFSRQVKLAQDQELRLDISLKRAVLKGEEVRVSAERIRFKERIAPSVVSLDRRQIENAPAFAEADLFRVLQTLPSVQTLNDYSSALYVRGSTPDQNLILLDGIMVYNPMHLGGIFSTFNTDAIQEAEFHAGGFPARYGGRMGAILNIMNREGNSRRLAARGNLSLLSSKLLLEGPLPKWGRKIPWGSWMLAGRRTYTDLLINGIYNLFKPSVEEGREEIDKIFPYYFYDYQGKVNLNLGANHRLTGSTFYGDDVFYWRSKYSDTYYFSPDSSNYTSNASRDLFDWRWGNFTNSLHWRWLITPRLVLKTFLAGSRFRFTIKFRSLQSGSSWDSSGISTWEDEYRFDLFDYVRDRSLKLEGVWRPNERHTWSFGFQHKDLYFNLGMLFGVDNDFNGEIQSFRDTVLWMEHKTYEQGLYVQDLWRISPLWSTQAGLRLNRYGLGSGLYLAPRWGTKFYLQDNLALKLALGRYYQFLTVANAPDENLRFIDVWLAIPGEYRPSHANHYIAGLEYLSVNDILLRLEVYYKQFSHLLTLKPSHLVPGGEPSRPQDPFSEFWDTEAYARGLEFLAQKNSGRLQGWLGYTWAQTKRRFAGEDWYAPKYDRIHTLHLVTNWSLSETSNLSFTLTYATGNPYTPVLGTYELWQTEGNEPPENGYWSRRNYLYGARNSARYPAYFRLDFSYRSRHQFSTGYWEWYFQVLNVTNHMNVFTYFYYTKYRYLPDGRQESEGLYRRAVPMFPLLPTIGVRFVL